MSKKVAKMKSKAPAKLLAVKKEPADHNKESLCHLVDDRVEMIRQIFQTLKTKTIKSIAPDFLQECSAESLQEYCLDELLGISNKRLLSIIQATKCPSDTEDTDSDLENIEEHISLEEISSDSEDDRKKRVKPSTVKGAAAKDAAPKPMSMLELLELQARARAIRSQLALEPVTKIELDSDNEPTVTPNTSAKDASAKESVQPKPPQVPAAPEARPIRLKRNFRQRQNADYEPSDEEASTAPVDDPPILPTEVQAPEKVPAVELPTPEPTVSATIEVTSSTTVTEPEPSGTAPPKSRSPSPDIVPIISSPPTFCISSDDSDNEDQQFLQKIQKAGNYINMPIRVTVTREETADEIFLRKVKQTSVVVPAAKSIFVEPVAPASLGNLTEKSDETTIEKAESETEEGEISDEDEHVTSKPESKESEKISNVQETEIISLVDDPAVDESTATVEDGNPNTSKASCTSSSSSSDSSGDDDDGSDEEPVVATDAPLVTVKTEMPEPNRKKCENLPIDYDADIIDLGEDEVLDFDGEAKEEENDASDNWGNRWLRCKKVTKVIATARLASKVRSKIKKNKKQEARAAEAAAAEKLLEEQTAKAVPEPPPADPTIEEGSVEQYAKIRSEPAEPKPAE